MTRTVKTERLYEGIVDLSDYRAILAQRDELLAALSGLFEQCTMIHRHWGENSNVSQATDAINAARAAIAKAKATP